MILLLFHIIVGIPLHKTRSLAYISVIFLAFFSFIIHYYFPIFISVILDLCIFFIITLILYHIIFSTNTREPADSSITPASSGNVIIMSC